VAGPWPLKGPFRRASKFNGVFPLKFSADGNLSSDEYKEIVSYINQLRYTKGLFDFVFSMFTYGDKEKDLWISKYIDVGANWLVDCIYPGGYSKEEIFDRIRKGPPSY
jgi:hypothetical protein